MLTPPKDYEKKHGKKEYEEKFKEVLPKSQAKDAAALSDVLTSLRQFEWEYARCSNDDLVDFLAEAYGVSRENQD